MYFLFCCNYLNILVTKEAKQTKEDNNNFEIFSSLFLPLKNETTHLNNKILNIFCIHPISGSALLYRNLAEVLPKWTNIVGVQFAFDYEYSFNKITSLVELAEYYAEKVN